MLGLPDPGVPKTTHHPLKTSRRGTQLVNAADVTFGVRCVGLGWVGLDGLDGLRDGLPMKVTEIRFFLDGNLLVGSWVGQLEIFHGFSQAKKRW